MQKSILHGNFPAHPRPPPTYRYHSPPTTTTMIGEEREREMNSKHGENPAEIHILLMIVWAAVHHPTLLLPTVGTGHLQCAPVMCPVCSHSEAKVSPAIGHDKHRSSSNSSLDCQRALPPNLVI
ncbi:hypothetical protein JZ751_008761 [Albula glossodonta]|uniref:Uncharacterized protein n=1 Tax=Albula glossodonta TaxID=121402 RepID=A0A8T2PA96_9TELE|nr:hypothetical protein JZ751_008761 [Albula glossodonta]